MRRRSEVAGRESKLRTITLGSQNDSSRPSDSKKVGSKNSHAMKTSLRNYTSQPHVQFLRGLGKGLVVISGSQNDCSRRSNSKKGGSKNV